MSNRFGGCFSVFVSLLLVVSLFLNLIFLGALSAKSSGSSLQADSPFEEEFVEGKESSDNKIAVVDLTGVIGASIEGETGNSMLEDAVARLKRAREDDKVKVVILRIDSPGGEVNASDILYHQVSKIRAVKPVLVYMESVAASGGYYAAMGGSYLMASELTITASIGVILQTINYKDLFGKVGLKTHTFKSGKFKDMLNPSRDVTPEEEAYVQALIMETYDKFVGIVARERKLDVDKLKQGVADGRIVTGKQALEAGLVDELGYFEDAVKKAAELKKLKDYRVVRYIAPFHFSRLLKLFGQGPEKAVRIQVGPETVQLESGRLYYLSTHLFSGR
jgi:protease-4